MLVLSRRLGEEIVIGEDVNVTVVDIRGGRVLLGVTAPRSLSVDRAEVHRRKAASAEFLREVDPGTTNQAVKVL